MYIIPKKIATALRQPIVTSNEEDLPPASTAAKIHTPEALQEWIENGGRLS